MSKEKEERNTKVAAATGEFDTSHTQDRDDVSTGTESGRPGWLVPAVSAAVVVVLIAAGVVCLRVVSGRGHTQAIERCSGAVARLEKPAGGADARTARYQEAAGISSDQVKDVKTVIAMARAVKNAGGIRPQPVRCDASMTTEDLKTATDKTKKLNGKYDKLDKAAKTVLASRDAKELDDARAALEAKKDEASKLLGDSDGKVADNATRETLQNAIGLAEQTTGDKVQAWRDAVGPLQTAIDQVNASMQAKTQADQQAAQEATPSYGGGHTPFYRPSHGQGGDGSWLAPAPVQQPAPSTPSGGAYNPGVEEWMNTHVPSKCQAGGSCGIG